VESVVLFALIADTVEVGAARFTAVLEGGVIVEVARVLVLLALDSVLTMKPAAAPFLSIDGGEERALPALAVLVA
jgi:hypothetical protein